MDQREIEYGILRLALSSQAAMKKLKAEGITPKHFCFKEQPTAKSSATSWLYEQALAYYNRSGALLTLKNLEVRFVEGGISDENRGKMMLLWSTIQEEDVDENNLQVLIDLMRTRASLWQWDRVMTESTKDLRDEGLDKGLLRLSRGAAEIQQLSTPKPRLMVLSGPQFAAELRQPPDPDDWTFNVGLRTIDDNFGPIIPECFIAIAGPTGKGKSTVLTDFAVRMMLGGANVLVCSYELPRKEYEARIAARLARGDWKAIRNRHLTEDEIDRIAKEIDELLSDGGSICVDDESEDSTVERLEERLFELEAEGKKPHVIVVDHLGIMRSREAKHAKPYEVQELVVRKLRVMARKYKVALFVAQQYNKGAQAELRQAKTGQTVELGIDMIGGTVELSNAAWGIFNISRDDERGVTYLNCLKNRPGGNLFKTVVKVDGPGQRLDETTEWDAIVGCAESNVVHLPTSAAPHPQEEDEGGEWSFEAVGE